MSQKDGANYVVIYQMLCLMTINTGGKLSRTIGEVIIPFDVEKIQRDCKWFSVDTIRVALSLYKRLGLIYEDADGTLVLAKHSEMVGSKTDWANQKRQQRLKGKIKQAQMLQSADNAADNVHTEIRDKRTEYRETTTTSCCCSDEAVGCSCLDDERPSFDTLEVYAANNLQYLSPRNMEQLVSFKDELPEETIRWAIDEACAKGKRNFSYVRGILNNLLSEGIRTVGDAQAAQDARKTPDKPPDEQDVKWFD